MSRQYPPDHPTHFDHRDNEGPPPYQREPTSDAYYPGQGHYQGDDLRRSEPSLPQAQVQQSPYMLRRESISRQVTPKPSRRETQEIQHHQRDVQQVSPLQRTVSRSMPSQPSRASSVSGLNVVPDGRHVEASQIVDILRKEIAHLTGGRDRQGGPVITFPPHQPKPNFNSSDIIACLKYLAQIPSEESKRRGFTAIVDSRDGSWQNLVTVLGCLKQALGEYIKQVLVVKADPTLDRGSSSSSFRRDRNSPNIEPQFVSIHRLYTYVDKNQLTGMFGGHLSYRHEEWLQNRLDLEKFIRETRAAMSHLDDSETQIHQVYSKTDTSSPLESLRQHRFLQESILGVPTRVIRDGRELLARLQQYSNDQSTAAEEDAVTTLDNLEDQKQVKRMIQYLEGRVDKLQQVLEDRDRSLSINLQYEDLQRNIKTVLTWILGPGEKLLASQIDIGDSFQRAEDLRKQHEELEIKCTDTYGTYAELRHKAEELISEEHTASEDVRSIRDYMDTVCRSFASRLERRRTLLITSVRFHRLAEEFSKKLEDLLELLYSDNDAEDVKSAEMALQKIIQKCEALDTLAKQTLEDGQSLLDEMSRPVKNAQGKDITPDYDLQVKHVNGHLEDLQERKLRCDELADVKKLKLQQILQLRTCERDADQAIEWIYELCEVMSSTHTSMGNTIEEAENLQKEHKKFESTANGTYEYGKQLLQAALVLRRSLRYSLDPNNDRAQRLEEAWKCFSHGTNERANRLTVAAMFLSSADKILDKIDDILVAISQTLSGERTVPDVLKSYSPIKRKVEEEYQETSHMGKTLIERLSLPVISLQGREKSMSVKDQEAMEIIGSKLNKLDDKIYDLKRYWKDMESTKLPPPHMQYDSRKRQKSAPARSQTISHPTRPTEHSKPKQRKSTSDLSKQPIQRVRSRKTAEKPVPPQRSGSLNYLKTTSAPEVVENIPRTQANRVQAAPSGSMRGPPIDGRALFKEMEEVRVC
ncbi:hypothetical protein FSP39_011505 [Pinctada imbricata]|uniref:SESTD1-like spectrin repeats region domain-containing protein n=1 Tax=Pinctada imbricata TaxID=66713 RepID=A0AA88XD62_PINIB|nr:hypothetical protein FSP39_011505 [Pinctada imbricata]